MGEHALCGRRHRTGFSLRQRFGAFARPGQPQRGGERKADKRYAHYERRRHPYLEPSSRGASELDERAPDLTEHVKRFGDYVVDLETVPAPFYGAMPELAD